MGDHIYELILRYDMTCDKQYPICSAKMRSANFFINSVLSHIAKFMTNATGTYSDSTIVMETQGSVRSR